MQYESANYIWQFNTALFGKFNISHLKKFLSTVFKEKRKNPTMRSRVFSFFVRIYFLFAYARAIAEKVSSDNRCSILQAYSSAFVSETPRERKKSRKTQCFS